VVSLMFLFIRLEVDLFLSLRKQTLEIMVSEVDTEYLTMISCHKTTNTDLLNLWTSKKLPVRHSEMN